jgi:hypothetical protein
MVTEDFKETYSAADIAGQWAGGYGEGISQAVDAARLQQAVNAGVEAFEAGEAAPGYIAQVLEHHYGPQAAEAFVGYWEASNREYEEPYYPESPDEWLVDREMLNQELDDVRARAAATVAEQEEQTRFDANRAAIGEALDRNPDAREHVAVLEEAMKLVGPDADPEQVGSFIDTAVRAGREDQRVKDEAQRVAEAQHFKQIDMQNGWTDGLSGREQRAPTKAQWENYNEARVTDRANEILSKSELNLRNIVPETSQEIAEAAHAPLIAKIQRGETWDSEVHPAYLSAKENQGKRVGGEIGTDRSDFTAKSKA